MTSPSETKLAVPPQEAKTAEEGIYFTFSLGREEYGLPILKVKEIIGLMPITAVPQAPEHVNGVINLRGKVIPVIDLRRKFSMPAVEYTERTCIIVVEIGGESGPVMMSIVVDAVSDVLNIKNEKIEGPPSLGTQKGADYILGMAKTENDVKILLDIDQVLGGEEIAALEDEAA